ncbi:MAG TPA: efflux RND transporter periplasmic adaptor subunit [Candidatus Baltobacteraceae bacterium]
MQYQRLAIAGALVASLALTGCGGNRGPRGPQPLNVDVATAQRRDIATSITLDGQIAPLEQSTVAFQQSGPIAAIYVNVGDRVGAGQVVAKIDDSTLRAQLAQAQAQANQAAATARGSQVGLPIARQSNASTLLTAKAALANAQLIYQQDEQLFKQGYVSQQQLEAARAQYVQAHSQSSAAVAGQQNDVVSSENVKASLAGAQAAAAQAGVLSTELSQTAVYSPFEGVVTARLMDPGAMAGPSAPVLQIARTDKVWVNINVPDEDLPYVHPGQTITFSSSSLPGKTFTGTVGTVNSVPTQGTLSYLARIQENNPGDVLRGGMLVIATIPKQKAIGAVVVPLSAIAQTQNGSAVFVVRNNVAYQVPIKVGLQTDTLSQVVSPQVTTGTVVITTRPDALQDKSPVAVNGAGSPGPAASVSPAAKGAY